jgi:REP element-mobilizing transposase RayT
MLRGWREELRSLSKTDSDAMLRRRLELYLDQGHGACHLKDPRVAEVVQQSLLFFDGERYKLSAWVVMPNHVHALLTPLGNQLLSRILHSLKSYTSNEANRILGVEGKFWQQESFDRYIRNSRHYAAAVRYIEDNPIKARLCDRPEDWPYGSAGFKAKVASAPGSAGFQPALSK